MGEELPSIKDTLLRTREGVVSRIDQLARRASELRDLMKDLQPKMEQLAKSAEYMRKNGQNG